MNWTRDDSLHGRRSGVLVARDLNKIDGDGMENIERFFSTALDCEENSARFPVVEQCDAVPVSLLASVRAWWQTTSQVADLSSVSTAPGGNGSIHGSIIESIESEIETSSPQYQDESHSTPRGSVSHADPSEQPSSARDREEISPHTPHTYDDPMVGMIVTGGRENRKESLQGAPLDQSLLSALMDSVHSLQPDDSSNDLQKTSFNAEGVSSLSDSATSTEVDSQAPNDTAEEDPSPVMDTPPPPTSTPTDEPLLEEASAALNGSMDKIPVDKSPPADIRQRKQERARMIEEAARFETQSTGAGNESDGEPLFCDGDESPVCPPSPSVRRSKPSIKRRRTRSSSGRPAREKATKAKAKTSKGGRKKKKRNPYATVFTAEGIPQPRTYRVVPVTDLKPAPPADIRLRRSERAKVAPLKHWCGERMVYGPNDFGSDYDGVRNMSMVTGFSLANPTQYKQRRASKMNSTKSSKEQRITGEEEFDVSKMRGQFRVVDGCTANLVDTQFNTSAETHVIGYFDELEFHKEPSAASSQAKRKRQVQPLGAIGISSPSLNKIFPGYAFGSLRLPKGAVKEGQTPGETQHNFTVVACQPKSLHLVIEHPEFDESSEEWDDDIAHHFVLSNGDNFAIPAGNRYRLVNHSKQQESTLSISVLYKPDVENESVEMGENNETD